MTQRARRSHPSCDTEAVGGNEFSFIIPPSLPTHTNKQTNKHINSPLRGVSGLSGLTYAPYKRVSFLKKFRYCGFVVNVFSAVYGSVRSLTGFSAQLYSAPVAVSQCVCVCVCCTHALTLVCCSRLISGSHLCQVNICHAAARLPAGIALGEGVACSSCVVVLQVGTGGREGLIELLTGKQGRNGTWVTSTLPA